MPEIVKNSRNTGELTVALYFKFTRGAAIFTLTALPKESEPCETIQLYHYNNRFHVHFESKSYESEVVIIFFLTLKVVKIIVSCYVVNDIILRITYQKRKKEFIYL